nr:zinc knuckle CX2CX4HX4C [Tanacetum cinerariifolium]
MQTVIENEPWLVDQKPLFVMKWELGLCHTKHESTRIPLWVKIYNISLEAWNVEGISSIASRLGTPIIMDRITTSMCEQAYGRASYARVLIEFDAAEGLVDSIDACYKSIVCKNRELTEEEIVKKAEDKRKNVERSGKEKGSDDGWKFMSYKKDRVMELVIRKKNESDGFMNVSKKGKVEVNVASHVKNDSQEGIHINNRFFTLDNKGDDADMNENQVACIDTDMEYETNTRSGKIKQQILRLENEIMERWKYISSTANIRANECVKEKMQETRLSKNLGMTGLYDEMYRQESNSIQTLNTKKQMLEVDMFMCLQIPLTDEIKDRWTDVMEEYFNNMIELRNSDIINRDFDDEDTNNMGDEVAKNTSAHATFTTQDNVSNVVDPVGNKEKNESDGFMNVSKKGKVEVNVASHVKNDSQEGIHINNRFFALDNKGDDADINENQVAGIDTDMEYETNTISGKIKQQILRLENEIMERWKYISSTANIRANERVKEKMQETRLSKNLGMPGLYDEMYRQESDSIQTLNTKKQMLEVDMFMCLQIPLTDEIKDRWTDVMEEYFNNMIELRNSDIINRDFNDEDTNNMGDEVAKNTSAHATFTTQDNVSNVVDPGIAQMQSGDASNPPFLNGGQNRFMKYQRYG